MNPADFMICTMKIIKVSLQGYIPLINTALKPLQSPGNSR